jgi:hypothetical protein
LGAGIGGDCWGNPQSAVRYDSPTWGGFRFETSYGTNTLTGPLPTPDSHFWDIAGFYTADWNSIKVSVAGAYTWIETGVNTGDDVDLWQVGGSVWHKPSGLGIYAMGQWEETSGQNAGPIGFAFQLSSQPTPPGALISLDVVPSNLEAILRSNPDTDMWYIKPFWRKAWSPIGATVLYGEYGQYNDQFLAGRNLCFAGFTPGSAIGNFCNSGKFNASGALLGITNTVAGAGEGVFATGSETEQYGLGVVQEIDSAAMHLWARWRHIETDVQLIGFDSVNSGVFGSGCENGCRIKQNFEDLDIYQVGGIIFF